MSVLDNIRIACEMYDIGNIEEANKRFEDIRSKGVYESDIIYIKENYFTLLEEYRDNANITLVIYSYLVNIIRNESIFCEFLKWTTDADIEYEVKYFVCVQIVAWMFWYPQLRSCNSVRLATLLLSRITQEVKSQLPQHLFEEIPREQLNNDLVVIVVNQYLEEKHGPTKHALDHCVSLIESMNKKVLLINTAEGRNAPNIIFCNMFVPAYYSELCNKSEVNWKGYNIPFFQCDEHMPNTLEIKMLLETIRSLKPSMVIEIGSGSIVAALLENIVPVLTNGTLHSEIEVSATKYQTIARSLTNEEIEMLHMLGRNEENMIYSMFSTEITRKSDVVTREMLGLKEDDFAIAIVGGRLSLDISEYFMEKLAEIVSYDERITVLFIGNFNSYEKLVSKYPGVRNRLVFHGFTDNALGCLEKCDIYLNPHRTGGGMSAIEAMVAGIPAVSTNYGDAGVVLGQEFWVDDIEDIPGEVIKLFRDKKYYEEQRNRAVSRGIYLQDSDRLFGDTIKEFQRIIEQERK